MLQIRKIGKIIQVWDKTVKYINDPATRDDAVAIMAKRVSLDAAQYAQFIDGTHLLDLQANKKVFTKSNSFDSIYGSSYHVNEFNFKMESTPLKWMLMA